MKFKNFNYYTGRHEQALQNCLNSFTIPAQRLKEAIYYALFPGGKRLRPLLIYLTGEALQVPEDCLDCLGAAVELLHAYSLIHDDLPAMDNDDYRRGKLSCHRAYDEATAILAGDALQSMACEYLLSQLPLFVSPLQVININKVLMHACGVSGMVSGQSLDLTDLSIRRKESDIRRIHYLKTVFFMQACVQSVVLASNASPLINQAFTDFADHLGLAFQIQDDYLDRFAAPQHLGKNRPSDEANQKYTFASLYDQQDLKKLIIEQFERAKNALTPLQNSAQNLLLFCEQIQQRSNFQNG